MREARQSIFKADIKTKSLLFCTAFTLIGANIPCYGQLPNTNFGQFVHQPGDNQYTNQTQAERHAPVMPVNIPVSNAGPASGPASASASYKLTPAEPKPDVSLLPVVADEPIKPAGFPPLPDRLDLPTSGSASWASGSNQGSAGNSASGGTYTREGVSHNPQGVHQFYVHYAPGAFMPDQPVQQAYRPSNTDYYNVNPGARPAMRSSVGDVPLPNTNPINMETPSTVALKHMGPEPQLASDKASKPEAPTAVTVNQSVSQDLSLPEDDFNKHYPTNINNTPANRTANGIGSALAYPARMLLYSGAGMAMGAASMAGSTVLMHR